MFGKSSAELSYIPVTEYSSVSHTFEKMGGSLTPFIVISSLTNLDDRYVVWFKIKQKRFQFLTKYLPIRSLYKTDINDRLQKLKSIFFIYFLIHKQERSKLSLTPDDINYIYIKK